MLSFILFGLEVGIVCANADESLHLTEIERAWIEAHPNIRVANEGDWPPFDYVENGKPQGYSIGIIKLIAQKTGLQFIFVNGYSWAELLQKFRSGEIDIMPAMYVNTERKKFTLFTQSYYSQPSVMAIHKNNKQIKSINDLTGQRIAVIQGFSITTSLKKILPDINIVPVKNILAGLKAVSVGGADAFIDSLGTVSYTLDNNYIPNLRLVTRIDHSGLANPRLHMGVSKSNPILLGILDKALAGITRAEKSRLANRWLVTPTTDYKETSSKAVVYSPKQQLWLNSHPKIRVGIMNAWPPMDYVDPAGVAQGIGVRFIQALNMRIGERLVIVPGDWNTIYQALKDEQLDAIMDVTPRPDREAYMHFTKPYIEVPHLIFTRKGEPLKQVLADLNGKTVAVETAFFIGKVLRDSYPNIRVKEYATTSDALDALSKSEVDAYVGNRAVANYIIENELITNIIAQGKISETSSVNAIGVRKNAEILRDILQLSLQNISAAERSTLINPKPSSSRIDGVISALAELLTSSEKKWLKTRTTLRIGVDHEWPPVEWIDGHGDYQGMTSDYMRIISDMLGLPMAAPQRLRWTEVLDRATRGEMDLLPAVVSTLNRRKYLNFTAPYLTFPYVIFTRDDAPLVTELRDIYNKRVGIEDGYFTQEVLQRDHPALALTAYKTTKQIMQDLSIGKLDAYVGNLTAAVYLINQEGLTNIKVAAPTKYSADLSIGVRKDSPELLSIMEKSLSLIDENKRSEIRQRWLKLNYAVGVKQELVTGAAMAAAFLILLVLVWLIFIQGQKRKLKESKAETEKANQAYLVANNELLLANTKLKEMDRMKSMFVASISHELRTPLNSIIGFSNMMIRGSFGDLNEKYQDYTTRINNSGLHLLNLITDIIDMSKIEAGRVQLVIEDFELQEIVSEARDVLGEQIAQKGLSLEIQLEKGIVLHTDKRRLYQCLLNLLSNASKYTEYGGIVLSASEQDQKVLIKISDTGIGIRESDWPRLFKSFERMESHLQIKAGGTGLGLYLTRKIVTQFLQGEVGVDSTLGQGSTFWIKLPRIITSNIKSVGQL